MIGDLEVEDIGLDGLAAKFVRDWRIKTRKMEDGITVQPTMNEKVLAGGQGVHDKTDYDFYQFYV